MAVLKRVSESVYCVQRRAYLSCSYFVTLPDGVVCVDAGIDASGGDMVRGLGEAGRDPADVRAILLTHWHNDHAAGAARIQARSGARVYYHAAAAPWFTREKAATGWRAWLARRLPDAGPFGPMRGMLDAASPVALPAHAHVAEGDTVEEHFKVFETPGHEVGHVSFLFEPERVLFAGDALAVAGDHVTYIGRWLTRDVEAARASMLRCLDLAPKAICPGHRHPLIDPTPDHLARVRAEAAARKRWPIFGA
jgi:glyoxylase-like metal-dependent hydrolase (beta-lactamase superfamily II)